jgi:hypothetical protein
VKISSVMDFELAGYCFHFMVLLKELFHKWIIIGSLVYEYLQYNYYFHKNTTYKCMYSITCESFYYYCYKTSIYPTLGTFIKTYPCSENIICRIDSKHDHTHIFCLTSLVPGKSKHISWECKYVFLFLFQNHSEHTDNRCLFILKVVIKPSSGPGCAWLKTWPYTYILSHFFGTWKIQTHFMRMQICFVSVV